MEKAHADRYLVPCSNQRPPTAKTTGLDGTRDNIIFKDYNIYFERL